MIYSLKRSLVLPIVIYVTIYPWFKNVFTQWLSIFITNLLTVYIVGILLTKFIEAYGNFMTKLDNQFDNGSITSTVIFSNSLIMGILLLGLMKIAVALADKIGTASIETLTQKGMGGKDEKGNFEKGTAGAGAESVKSGTLKTAKGLRAATKFLGTKGRPSGSAFSGDAV